MQLWALRLVARQGDLLYLLPALLLLWYALTAGQDWVFGLTAVLAAVILGRLLGTASIAPVSIPGLLRFMLYFLHRSAEGGIDVAWRALHPHKPLVINEGWRTLDLPDGTARMLFIAAASLLPGTLACNCAGDRVYIHSISDRPGEKLDELEAQVRRVFKSCAREGAGS